MSEILASASGAGREGTRKGEDHPSTAASSIFPAQRWEGSSFLLSHRDDMRIKRFICPQSNQECK